MKLQLSFFVLNLIFLIGLFFPGYSLGLYFCTFIPFLVLIKKNHGAIKSNKILIFLAIFFANISVQILIGYPPNIKLTLNFLGNLVMIYSIASLLSSEIALRKYLEIFFKLHVIVAMIIVVLGVGLNGLNFYLLPSNYIYTSLDKFLPVLYITKQVVAPFMIAASIMGIYFFKPNSFLKNLIIGLFVISAIFMAFGSRSVILGVVITILIFIFKKLLSQTIITTTVVLIFAIGLGVLNNFFESYLDIIRLIDIRGIIYSEVINEIIAHPLGIGYGNTVPYLSSNNAQLFSNSSFYLEGLKEYNEDFAGFEFESFPVNVESSLFIGTLEQGVLVMGVLYIFFVTKFARMFFRADKLTILYTIVSSVVFFTSLTEDNFLLIPFLFYIPLFLRLNKKGNL